MEPVFVFASILSSSKNNIINTCVPVLIRVILTDACNFFNSSDTSITGVAKKLIFNQVHSLKKLQYRYLPFFSWHICWRAFSTVKLSIFHVYLFWLS